MWNSNNFIQNAKIIAIAIDANDVIISANNYTLEVVSEDICGKKFSDLFVNFTLTDQLLDEIKKGAKGKHLSINTKSNVPLTFIISTYLSGDNIYLFGEPDVSNYSEIQRNISLLNNDLNNMARKLTKQNVQLNELNKLKNQYLGMTAHDLRNPIGNILMYAEFVLENKENFENEELHQVVNAIRQSSEYMLGIIDELLNVVKLESAKIELRLKEVDVNALVKETIEVNRLLADKKNIAINLQFLNNLRLLSIDDIKIKEVCNNLLTNAIKYSYPNTTVNISLFETDTDFVFSIKNNGPIIPSDKIKFIFTPFASIGVKPTGAEKSHGLGLSIVKQIVAAHQGKIWVESKEAIGTTFAFSLPLKK